MQKSIVVEHRYKLKSLRDHLLCHRDRVAMDGGVDARLTRGREDGYERVYHDRINRYAARRRAAQRNAQIARADIEAVESGHAEDVVEVVYCLPGFYHGKRDQGIVRLLEMVSAAVPTGTHRTEAAVAFRRITAGTDKSLAIGARVDHRTDDAVSAGIEQLPDDAWFVPGRAHQRDRRRRADRLQHGDGGLVIDMAMLQVDGQ